MSFLSKAWKSVRGIAAPVIGGMLGGPIGAVVGTALAGGNSVKTVGALPSSNADWVPQRMSFGPGVGAAGLASLPRLTSMGSSALSLNRQAITGMGAAAGRAVGSATRSAMTYCRRHPVWCSTLGIAGVEALVSSGQLPPIKRRRARGITGRELSNFKRVSRLLNTWCKTPPPTKRRAARSC